MMLSWLSHPALLARRLLSGGLLGGLLLVAGGCSLLPQGDIYKMHRDAQLAYTVEEDDRAEKLYLGLARAAPTEPDTWFYLGNLYARSNRPEKAAEAYQKALMLNSTDARVWHNIGVIRVREAWAAFIQAHALVPADDPTRVKLEALIDAMEKIPLDGLKRSAAKNAPAAATTVAPNAINTLGAPVVTATPAKVVEPDGAAK